MEAISKDLTTETSLAKKASGWSNLTSFFFTAYVLQGIACAQFGVIGQPVQYFLMQGLNLDAGQISTCMSLMMIPWIIKPIYGLISDSVPLFGYHRKSYLILASFVASVAFLLISQFCFLNIILLCLAVAAICMAISTALMVGLAVERGRYNGRTRDYFRIQEIGYYLTNIFVVTGAGYLCQIATPETALKFAAQIASASAIALSLMTLSWLKENRKTATVKSIPDKIKSTIKLANSKELRHIFILTILWNFTLAFGVSLYYHESKTLLFSQSFIGQLSAWMACGILTGAFFFNKLTKNLSKLERSYTGAALLIASTLSYSLLNTPLSAILIELLHGFSNIFAMLTIYGLASDNCREGAEAYTMSLIVAILNLTTCCAIFFGGQLFTHCFNTNYSALVFVAMIPPVLSLLLINCSKKVES